MDDVIDHLDDNVEEEDMDEDQPDEKITVKEDHIIEQQDEDFEMLADTEEPLDESESSKCR